MGNLRDKYTDEEWDALSKKVFKNKEANNSKQLVEINDVPFSIRDQKPSFYEDREKREYPLSPKECFEKAKKESEGKVDYTELDWDFIDAMALKMSSETKYEKDNYKKPINIIELIKPIMRHGRKALQPIPNDPETLYNHLVSISLNAMMAAYQLKNNNND